MGIYGATKAAATLVASAFAVRERLPLAVLRPFSVYGPGEGGQKFVPSVIRACLKGENPRLSSCRQIRDYLYVDDLVESYLKAAGLRGTPPVILNVASGVGLSLRDLAAEIVRYFPGARAEFGALPDRDGEIWKVQADITRAKTVMGWAPTWSLEKGIGMTVEWFRRHDSRVG